MSELRKDPILDRWVVLAPKRAERPRLSHDENARNACPFCPGHESETPPEVLALGRAIERPDTPGWSVRVFPNKYPAFVPSAVNPTSRGLFLARPARGEHEVVVTSPVHEDAWGRFSDEQGTRVLEAVSRRREVLAAREGVSHVFAFENAGESAGATLPHPHLQMMGLPRMAPVVEEELHRAEAWYRAESTCPYCFWIEEELRSGDRVLEAGAEVVTLVPFAPRFPFEFWILPRIHEATFPRPGHPMLHAIAVALRDSLARLVATVGRLSYNWVLHSASPGDPAWPFYHWHIEVLPQTVTTAGFEWGTGLFLHHLLPEEAARQLRGASTRGDRETGC